MTTKKKVTKKRVAKKVTIMDALTAIQDQLEEGVKTWMILNSGTKLKNSVFAYLEKNKEKMIMKILGFENQWGDHSWNIDHCNGRGGESSEHDHLKKQMSKQIDEFFETVIIPPMSIALKKKIIKDQQARIRYQIEKKVSVILDDQIETFAKEIVSQITDTAFHDKQLEIKKLLVKGA